MTVIHTYFITQRNLLSQSYHWTFSNKYEVRTRQYNGDYVTKKWWNWTRGSQTHTDRERKWQTDDYEYALHDTVLYQVCYKRLLFSSVHLHQVSVLSCLVRNINDKQRKEQQLRCQFYSGLLPVLQSDPMKRRTFGPLKLQTGRQWAKVSSCPLKTTNKHSLSFLHVSPLPPASHLLFPPRLFSPFGLWLGLGWASTSLGILAGGALCLRGWGGPRVPFWRKTQTKICKKKRIYEILSILSSSKWFGIPNSRQ